MQSDDDAVRGGGGHGTGGNVSQPFVTETYRCVAQYETKDTKNKPFKVAVDEKVDVLIKDKAGENTRPSTSPSSLSATNTMNALLLCWFRMVAGGEGR